MSLRSLAPILLVLLAAPCAARAADLIPPAAHRALYELQLESAKNGETSEVHGSMAYEITDACDGWATRQRLALTITNHDGQSIETVSDYLTWERKDGMTMTFRMKQTTDGAVTEQVEGDAKLDSPGGTGTVHYTQPAEANMTLPKGTVFPMAHTELLLAAAAAGKKFLAVPIFDGTGAKGAQDSSVSILAWTAAGATPRPGSGPHARRHAGRFRIAFFDRSKPGDKDRPDGTPDYEVALKYWANGVADDLHMDFSDFVMHGVLKQFAFQPPHC